MKKTIKDFYTAIESHAERARVKRARPTRSCPSHLRTRKTSEHEERSMGQVIAPISETEEVMKRVSKSQKPQNHDLQSDSSDIDEFDSTLFSEGLNLLRESRSRKKPKAEVVSRPFRRSEGDFSAKLLQDVDSDWPL